MKDVWIAIADTGVPSRAQSATPVPSFIAIEQQIEFSYSRDAFARCSKWNVVRIEALFFALIASAPRVG
jgi:hypothetical protein